MNNLVINYQTPEPFLCSSILNSMLPTPNSLQLPVAANNVVGYLVLLIAEPSVVIGFEAVRRRRRSAVHGRCLTANQTKNFTLGGAQFLQILLEPCNLILPSCILW
jgi:hypothetical protein